MTLPDFRFRPYIKSLQKRFTFFTLLFLVSRRGYESPPLIKAYRLYSDATPMLPCPCRTAASIHMHRIPMNKAWEILQATPENFAVTFINPDTPTFCKL